MEEKENQAQAALQRLRELSQSENEQVALKAAIELLNRGETDKVGDPADWVLKGP